ncbi:MAG: hypothetical protein J4428_05415 [Candidatus Aenigmarchaeota archaeon]|nr:hypothetical protein [Candidatus Aenigmarchaeota archaeon]
MYCMSGKKISAKRYPGIINKNNKTKVKLKPVMKEMSANIDKTSASSVEINNFILLPV